MYFVWASWFLGKLAGDLPSNDFQQILNLISKLGYIEISKDEEQQKLTEILRISF